MDVARVMMDKKRYYMTSIKASQSLSKAVVISLLAHTCTITLAALDGVIQLGKDHFIL